MQYGPYNAVVDKVQDGDTIYLTLDIGFDVTIFGRCRVYGINAPELSTDEGKAAKAYAEGLLPVGTEVSVVSHGWDKYGGRFDGSIVLPNGQDFGTLMLDAGQAVAYKG